MLKKVIGKKIFVEYDLLINEDDTEILINLNVKNYSKEIEPIISIITNNKKREVVKSSFFVHRFDNRNTYYHRYSLRENLSRGKYKIKVIVSKWDKLIICEESRKYLENGGNEFLFRLAASKQCSIEKSRKRK